MHGTLRKGHFLLYFVYKFCDSRCLLVCSWVYLFGGVPLEVVEWQMWFAAICLCSSVDEPFDIAIYVSNGMTSSKHIAISQSNLMYKIYIINVYHANILRLNRMESVHMNLSCSSV